jgi:hypothetical protein
VEERAVTMSEERRLVDAMLSVTQVEKEALLRKGEIVTAAERSVTTVRQTIVDGVESRKAIAGQAPPPPPFSLRVYTSCLQVGLSP